MIASVDVGHSSSFNVKGRDHFTHRDDQITKSFLYLVQRPIPPLAFASLLIIWTAVKAASR